MTTPTAGAMPRTGAPSGRYGLGLSLVLLLPAGGLILVVFGYPIGKLLLTSFGEQSFTTAHYVRLFEEPLYLRILLRTLRIAFLVTLFSLVLGYPVALTMSRVSGWKLSVVAACVLLPLWTSVLVRSYAWTVLLQRNGAINVALRQAGIISEPIEILYTEAAVLLAMVHILLPFMILPIYSALRGIPRDLTRAAENLGASGFAVFRRVTLPLSLPGIGAGVMMVFILSLGFFITPALLGGPRTMMISTLINQQISATLNWPFAGALAAMLLAITALLLVIFNKALPLGRLTSGA